MTPLMTRSFGFEHALWSPIFAAERSIGLWGLFIQSFDLFSIVLIIGSVVAVAIAVRCILDIRADAIIPRPTIETLRSMLAAGRLAEMREFARTEGSFVSKVLYAAMIVGGGDNDRTARREAAELTASQEVAKWFRKIEPLNLIGHLGPLVGLAGTVWGMIVAFTALSASAGQADPSVLSNGISKALFHTLLGLCLATPCLVIYGLYRSILDKHCTRAMLLASFMLESLPERLNLPRQPMKE